MPGSLRLGPAHPLHHALRHVDARDLVLEELGLGGVLQEADRGQHRNARSVRRRRPCLVEERQEVIGVEDDRATA